MSDIDIERAFLLMRKHGVRRLKVDTFEAELGPAEAEETTIPKSMSTSALEPERCECGHSVLEHNDSGECIHGCDAVKCDGKPSDGRSG